MICPNCKISFDQSPIGHFGGYCNHCGDMYWTVRLVNLTPHAITLQHDGTIPPSGTIARVSTGFGPVVNGVCSKVVGEVTGVPAPVNGTLYIVSAMVADALPYRKDVVAPATGHPDCERDQQGHIVSVPCLVK